ncbi:MAG: DUF547 domain-containing protein [Thermodesulfobacteriota bacterium]
MKNRYPALLLTLMILFFCPGILSTASAENFAFGLYQEFLGRYARPHQQIAGVDLTGVDYQAIANEAGQADSSYRLLLEHFSAYNPATLSSRNEKLAFWINAYNLGAIKMIIDHFPTDSIRSRKINFFKNPWGKKIINIGGSNYALAQIEHEILLGQLAEPMVHFAIVCASVSCPDLSPEVYHQDRLDGQLKKQAALFLNNRAKGLRIDRGQGIIYFSRIFKFDTKTFPDGAISAVDLIAPFLSGKDRSYLEDRKFRVEYLDYNWKLNSAGKND